MIINMLTKSPDQLSKRNDHSGLKELTNSEEREAGFRASYTPAAGRR